MALVAAVALAASIAGIRNQFVQDDTEIIARNALIHDLGNWREIVTSAYWPPQWEEDLYRPLTSLGLAVEYALGGGSPATFRLVSYLLYAACSIAFLALAWRLLPGPIALGAALLFAVHPVHVEAVALGVNQNEIGVGLIAVLMVWRYFDCRRSDSGIRSGDWIGLGVLYAVACLLKENALVLPGLLVGAELLLVTGAMRAGVKSLLPGYAFLAAVGMAALYARIAVLGQFDAPESADALMGLSAGGRALTMLQVVPHWIRLLTWPAHLQADYSPHEIVPSTGFGALEAAGLALVLIVMAIAWVARKRAPVVSFGLLWAGVALLPVSNILVPTGVVLAERTLFLPSMGFLLAIGGILGAAWRRAPFTRQDRSEFRYAPGARFNAVYWSILAALTVLGILRSAERHRSWKDPETFATRSATDAPRSWRAQGAYANLLYGTGQKDGAIGIYLDAIALAPVQQAWRVRNELAERYFAEGKYEMAVEQLRRSQAEVPDKRQTMHYLILGYLALGEYAEAVRLADSALALGGSLDLFGPLRAAADSARTEKAPPGSIRIHVQP